MSAQPKQIEVSEKPILCSGPMVRAILEGRKTQTRRVMKPQPTPCESRGGHWWPSNAVRTMVHVERELQCGEVGWEGLASSVCPYGEVGHRLWVRETFGAFDESTLKNHDLSEIYYRADDETKYESDGRWRPSIFMPRWASRINLEITNVRAERLNEISEEDAKAEGMQRSENTGMYPSPQGNCDHAEWAFHYGWDSINGKRKGCTWADNPFCWVIEFKKL